MHLEEGDRRWFTFASPEKNPASKEWWADKWRFLKHPESGLPDMRGLGDLLRFFQDRMGDIGRTGRFRPHERPPETEHKASLVEDSRSQFYGAVKAMVGAGMVPSMGGAGLTTLAAIEGDLGDAIRLPSNGQKRQDLEALGFTYVKRKDGRFWQVPDGFDTQPDFHAVMERLAIGPEVALGLTV